jgi:predicted anti-sigma-YlaC factor YlaD
MKCLDERIIELYVLGDNEIIRRKRSIEAHLRHCQACREAAAAMSSFYADVESELRRDAELPAKALTRTVPNAVFARQPGPPTLYQ